MSHRNWKLQKVNDYAVGFYIDVDAAFKAFKKKVSTPELAREALLKSGVKKTIRIVLAKETDTFKYVPSALTNLNLPRSTLRPRPCSVEQETRGVRGMGERK